VSRREEVLVPTPGDGRRHHSTAPARGGHVQHTPIDLPHGLTHHHRHTQEQSHGEEGGRKRRQRPLYPWGLA
jgi:hypothetical protein